MVRNRERTGSQAVGVGLRPARQLGGALVMFLLLVGPGVARADVEEDTLKGLAGVHVVVVVETFNEKLKGVGFDGRFFQTDVEEKLGRAGIRLLTEAEQKKAPGMPWLYLNINALHERQEEPAAYRVDLKVKQRARLQRNYHKASVSTWSRGMVGYGDLSHIHGSVKARVDEFIEAWLSVNPK